MDVLVRADEVHAMRKVQALRETMFGEGSRVKRSALGAASARLQGYNTQNVSVKTYWVIKLELGPFAQVQSSLRTSAHVLLSLDG